MTDVTVTCVVCNHSGLLSRVPEWHAFQHALQTAVGFGIVVPDKQPVVKQSIMPFDPVLRQALIDKGVLTIEDLRYAEMKIQAVTGLFNQEVRDADVPQDPHQPRLVDAAQPSSDTERVRAQGA